ncbi:MAG: DUF3048 domain-containing protein [Acidimicrobiia bacterium]|nr:DUF3048 domain-containing protein [Acidimicrobiia bacterium]
MRLPLVLLPIALVAAACSGAAAAPDPVTITSAQVPDSTTTTTLPPTTTTTSSTTTTTVDTRPTAPLTGVKGTVSDQQVLIVKLSNADKGRPQAGVNQADLVMEVLVEGGIGRWLAVFQTEYPETVGPVRSLREVDPKLIGPFDARLLSSGGQPAVRRDIAKVAVDESDGRITGYYRERGRPSVYDLMFDTEDLPDLDWEGTVEPLLEFDSKPAEGGETAREIEVRMSSRNQFSWTFDHGRYFRFQDGEASVDADGVEISADSIVVVFVRQISTGRVDAAGSPVPDYEVTGSGEAAVIRDGLAFPAEWHRDTEDDFFTFLNEAGDVIPLAPGRTWIHFTPTTGSLGWE